MFGVDLGVWAVLKIFNLRQWEDEGLYMYSRLKPRPCSCSHGQGGESHGTPSKRQSYQSNGGVLEYYG
jgi:hypothetical protein